MRVFLLMFLAACAATLARAQVPELRLQDAIAEALAHNRLLTAAESESLKAARRTDAVRAKGRPHASVNAIEFRQLEPIEIEFDRGVFGNFAGIGPVPSRDTTLGTPGDWQTVVHAGVAQPLTQLRRVRLGVKQAGLAEQVSRQKVRAQRLAVISEVRRTHYAMQQAQSALESNARQQALLAELEREVTRQEALRTVLRADLLDVRARLARSRHEALALASSRDTARDQLSLAMGRPIGGQFRAAPTSAPATGPLDFARLAERAVSRRPEAEEARLKAEAARVDVKLRKAAFTPDVSLSVNYLAAPDVQALPSSAVIAGLVVSWDLFDGGRKAAELDEGRQTARQAELNRVELEEQTRVQVRAQVRKILEARSLAAALVAAEEAAAERARESLERYRRQVNLLKDVLQADAAAADAAHQARNARLAESTARAELDRLIGGE